MVRAVVRTKLLILREPSMKKVNLPPLGGPPGEAVAGTPTLTMAASVTSVFTLKPLPYTFTVASAAEPAVRKREPILL